MAIETQCPSCTKRYKLKDELAGKRVTCGNPDCRKAFVVPGAPSTNGHVKAAPPVDAEALAALAFADDAKHDVPADQRRIKMKCVMCDAAWEEPWDRQGKNVLCPECKHRQKVPEQKTGKVDWRDPKAGRPTMAKVEELEGVVASTDADHVSGETLIKTGVVKEDIEPRPRWHYVAWVTIPLLALGLAVYAGMLVFQASKKGTRDEDMTEAVDELLTQPGDLPPGEVPLFRGAIQIAAGEYFIRGAMSEDGRIKAREYFGGARTELDSAPGGGGRDFLLGELAVAQLSLGGGPEEVGNGTRIGWAPGAGRAKISEKVYTVQEELRSTLNSMKREDKQSAYEVRLLTARRLAYALSKKGQPVLMRELIGQGFFDPEHGEATAWVEAETARAAGAGQAEAAAKLIEAMKAPAAPPSGSDVSSGTRQAHTAKYLLEGNAAEALALARRGADAEGRGKALALVAEWGDETTAAEAVRDAAGMVAGLNAKQARPTDPTLVRLAQAAGRTGQAEHIDTFAKVVYKDDFRAWAKAEGLRAALAKEGEKAADEKRAEIPDNPKEVHVGHAWGRLALARHNAKATGSGDPRDVQHWGAGFKPFGRAGQVLGLQDSAAK